MSEVVVREEAKEMRATRSRVALRRIQYNVIFNEEVIEINKNKNDYCQLASIFIQKIYFGVLFQKLLICLGFAFYRCCLED
jgi:hypothetical protein